MNPSWQPLTETEQALARAVAAGDELGYFAALAGGALLLPVDEEAVSGPGPVRWATVDVAGTTTVVAFTSRPAMPPHLLRRGVWLSPLFDVVTAVSGRGWGLAIDPGLPIQSFLTPERVTDLRGWEARWAPVELALRDAATAADPQAYLRALVGAALVLPLPAAVDTNPAAAERPGTGDYWSDVARSDPELGSYSRDVTDPDFPWWRAERVDGRPVILAFTTPVRMQAEVGERDWIEVPFLHVLKAWPDWGCALRVNSGATNGLELTGDALLGMHDAFEQVVREHQAAGGDPE